MICVALLALGMVVAEPVTIELSSSGTIEGEVVAITEQGLSIRVAPDRPPTEIAWFEINAGEVPSGTPGIYEQIAQQAWAAHARLHRGDTKGAMALFAGLSKRYLWDRGEQSMDVCDGLAACLIDAGHRVSAIEPMVAWFVAEGDQRGSNSSIDASLRLRRDLPPVFDAASRSIELTPIPVEAKADTRTQLIHAYYALVLAAPADRDLILDSIIRLQRLLNARDSGLVLLEQASFAQAHPDTSSRQGARDALARRAQTQGDTWTEVWSRLALGAALIRDEDPLVRDRGVVELIHIIVRLSTIDPDLTLLAAQIAREHLDATGREAWGAQLAHDARMNIAGLGPSLSRRETQNDE